MEDQRHPAALDHDLRELGAGHKGGSGSGYQVPMDRDHEPAHGAPLVTKPTWMTVEDELRSGQRCEQVGDERRKHRWIGCHHHRRPMPDKEPAGATSTQRVTQWRPRDSTEPLHVDDAVTRTRRQCQLAWTSALTPCDERRSARVVEAPSCRTHRKDVIGQPDCGATYVELALDVFTRCPSHLHRRLWIGEGSGDLRAEIGHVALFGEPPCLAVDHKFRDPREACRNDRGPTRHGLHQDHRHTLHAAGCGDQTGQYEEVAVAHQLRDLVLGPGAQELHPLRETRRLRRSLEVRPLRAIADDRQVHAFELRNGKCLEQNPVALVLHQAAHRQGMDGTALRQPTLSVGEILQHDSGPHHRNRRCHAAAEAEQKVSVELRDRDYEPSCPDAGLQELAVLKELIGVGGHAVLDPGEPLDNPCGRGWVTDEVGVDVLDALPLHVLSEPAADHHRCQRPGQLVRLAAEGPDEHCRHRRHS